MLKSFVRRTAIVRSTRAILATAAAVGVALAAAASANAATLTETFTFPNVAGYGSAEGSSFPAFDPALGTLNSVTYDVSGTATFSGGDDDSDNTFIYEFSFQGPGGLRGRSRSGSQSGIASGEASLTSTVSDPDIDAFFGPGSVSPSVEVSFEGGSAPGIVSTFATESVTYNYTPATPAAPEPSTWAMMGLGFAGLAFVGYRGARRGVSA